jgi:mannose-6-phosphate isomerase-like protein (cupin superfamily)
MDLFQPTRELLEALRAPLLAPFLAQWPEDTTQRRAPAPPVLLPVLSWLNQATAAAPALCKELVTAIAAAAPELTWKQTYTAAQTGAAFLENYGWCEIMGTSGAVPSERLACGFLLLGPHTLYPRHHHEAEEIYVPLVGTAVWEKGDEGWREQSPGTVIHHPTDIPHAMRTSGEALLALYLWRSINLRQKAQLVS